MKEIIAYALNNFGCFDFYIWGFATVDNYSKFGQDEINKCLNTMLDDAWTSEQEKHMINEYLSQENSLSLLVA